MATATSRKRFTKCVQCETTLILPERLKTTVTGRLTIFSIAPFADMDFRQSITLLMHRTPTLSASKSFLPGFRKQARRLRLSRKQRCEQGGRVPLH